MTLRKRLQNREKIFGCFQNIPAPEATEAAAFAGLDFVIIDLEHAFIDDSCLGAIIRAAESTGIFPVVRLPSIDKPRIGKILDIGASGIVIPHVHSEEEARFIVSATRYPPDGERSAAGLRTSGYGRKKHIAELVGPNAHHPTIIAMIEDKIGLKEAEKIMAVEGIDAILLGTADLSMDMEVPGESSHPDILAKVAEISRKAETRGISVGVPVITGEQANTAFEKGATFVTTSDIYTLIGGLEQFLSDTRTTNC